jgi:hydrogenase maturation protease
MALGNPLAGSDGFGGAVLARLREGGNLPTDVVLVDADTDLVGHIDALHAYDEVVLVDAVVGTGRAGDVAVFDEQTLGAWPEAGASCHHLTPVVAVKLFRTLYPQAPTRVTLVGLCVEEISFASGLPDEAVAAGAAEVIRLVALDS